MKPSCLVITGEKSGEEHCLGFFGDLRERCPDVHFWGVGGDQLEGQGLELLYNIRDFCGWGISGIILKIPYYLKALKRLEQEVIRRECKVAILVDFQDFNLCLAKRLKKRGVKILYYVAPTAWAWRSGRARVLGKIVHTLFTTIPFERKWFQSRGVENVIGIDHPLWTAHRTELEDYSSVVKEKRNRILLLPGSRNFEVESLLPLFISVIDELRRDFDLEVSIVGSRNVDDKLYAPWRDKVDRFYLDYDCTRALKNADMSIAASGTVTLTAALFEVPTVVCYRTSLINEFIFTSFIRYSGAFSLPNIIHEKMICPELFQDECTIFNIKKHLLEWLTDQKEYEKIKKELVTTKHLLKGELAQVSEYMASVIKSAKMNEGV